MIPMQVIISIFALICFTAAFVTIVYAQVKRALTGKGLRVAGPLGWMLGAISMIMSYIVTTNLWYIAASVILAGAMIAAIVYPDLY